MSGEPSPRQPKWADRLEREIRIRELRNAGSVISELASAGAIGRVTSDGRLVGWLLPATPSEQRAEELRAQGRLRSGRPGGLAGHRPPPRRTDTEPLSRTLDEQRRAADGRSISTPPRAIQHNNHADSGVLIDPAAHEAELASATEVFESVAQIVIDDAILDRASSLKSPLIRTLDAIHLASAFTSPQPPSSMPQIWNS